MPKVGIKPVRQAQLIEATLLSVEAHGLHGTTVTTISKIAGVSAGIISHYFGGKQKLLEATVRYLLQSLQNGLLARLQCIDQNDPVARLEAIIEANFSQLHVSDKGVKTWLAFWAQAMHDPEFARLQYVNERRLLSNLRFSLKQLSQQQRMPLSQVDRTAKTIAALIDGLWLRGALSPDPFDTQQAVNCCKQYIFDMLRSDLSIRSLSINDDR